MGDVSDNADAQVESESKLTKQNGNSKDEILLGQGKESNGTVYKSVYRKTCEFCFRRKIKCDGERPRCGQCQKRNLQTCTYTLMKRPGPKKREKTSDTESSSKVPKNTDSSRKRKPSKTLIGAQENSYINSFLTDMATFIPVADEVLIREGLINLYNPCTNDEMTISLKKKLLPRLSTGSACVAALWGCIAVGALLQNNHHIDVYLDQTLKNLAKIGKDPVGKIRVYLILALVSHMKGDDDQYGHYIRLAEKECHSACSLPSDVWSSLSFLTVCISTDLQPDQKVLFRVVKECYETNFESNFENNKLLAKLSKWRAVQLKADLLQDLASQILCAEKMADSIKEAELIQEFSNGKSSALAAFLITVWRGLLELTLFDNEKGIQYSLKAAKIFQEKPTILFFRPCAHACHILCMILLRVGNIHKYESLRQAFNVHKNGNNVSLESLKSAEEFNLESICDDKICRRAQMMLSNQVFFNKQPAPTKGKENASGLSPDTPHLQGSSLLTEPIAATPAPSSGFGPTLSQAIFSNNMSSSSAAYTGHVSNSTVTASGLGDKWKI